TPFWAKPPVTRIPHTGHSVLRGPFKPVCCPLSGDWRLAGVRALVPGDGPVESFGQRSGGLEPEKLLGFGHIQAAARLAVRLGGIEADPSFEARFFRDQLDEGGDRDFLA